MSPTIAGAVLGWALGAGLVLLFVYAAGRDERGGLGEAESTRTN